MMGEYTKCNSYLSYLLYQAAILLTYCDLSLKTLTGLSIPFQSVIRSNCYTKNPKFHIYKYILIHIRMSKYLHMHKKAYSNIPDRSTL